MIVTANHYFSRRPIPIKDWFVWLTLVIRPALEALGIEPRPPSDVDPIVPVRVNWGMWIADCPDPSCKGAEKVWEEGWFMCMSCQNAHADHRLLHTQFPIGRVEIEHLLEPRPRPNRNWEPRESLEFLTEENRQHGVEVA